MSGLAVVSSQLPRAAVALTVEKDHPREPISEAVRVRNLSLRSPTRLPPTARYTPSEVPSPPVTDKSLPAAMPPSGTRRDCQVNSGTLRRIEAAVVDLRRQRETTEKLVKQFLQQLSPPQAENAKVPIRHKSDHISITIPAPPFAPSAPLSSSYPVSVDRFALSASHMRSDSPNPSFYFSEASPAGTEEPPPPMFDGDRLTGQEFYNDCRYYIRSHPEAFEDDSARIRFVMSHMVAGRADRWANRELGVDRNGTLRFASWLDFADEFRNFFMHPGVQEHASDVLETDHYFQRNQTVSDYLEYFQDLIDDAGCSDLRYIVTKFRRGLNREISATLAMLPNPPITNPEAWFSLALEVERNIRKTSNIPLCTMDHK